ncbi:replication initiation protein [Enterococcus florum]|uniref:Replication initiation protein n=1 Tax=Enterococcus florum TaxID=2480627 RepID=A0A4P5P7H5_9ENTE|nr:Rep family protein [Enterococcus florum]GCF92144.1 replication initiation protein [Enterococcus florum]
MKKQAVLNCVMIVQQLDEQFWHEWDKDYIEEAKKGNIRPLLEEVVNRLEKSDCVVSEAYGIIHDKDEIAVWDSEKMENVIEKKAKHVHLLIKFDKGNTITNLAVTSGIEPQYLEKAKSGRYGYDNMTAYLVHAKDLEKFQYDPKEVVTAKGEDYFSVYNRRMDKWVKGRAIKEATETNQSIDYVVSEIVAGNLTKSQIMLTDDLYKIYALHKRKINEAFETFGESKSYQTIADLEAGRFKKTVIFIHAKSGVGKTILSKKIIKMIQTLALYYEKMSWEFCMTASTNPFDEYNGQEILFLDDIRADSLSVSDWLKLLDPYTISPISARYHNKLGSAKIIIITSTKEPVDFFENVRFNFSEDAGQFIRRVELLIKINEGFNLYTSTQDEHYMKRGKLLLPKKKNLDGRYSHKFVKVNRHKKNRGLGKILKTVQQNMKWKTKSLSQPSAKTTVTSIPKKVASK